MAVLEWGAKTEDRYVSGVSRGVFYDDTGKAYPWDGLISITEKPQTVEPTPVYNSLGLKYDIHGNASEKRHSLICYTYPEIMDEYLGMEYLDEFGCLVDERPPRKFNMVYRSDHDDHYVIHVLLGQIANFGELPHTTDSHTPGISNISMNLEGTQHEVYGTSHLMFDSRNPITASAESLLFGSRSRDANFNDFLNAELDWVPYVVNYAACLQPDYDNLVEIDMGSDQTTYVPGVKDSSKWNLQNVIVYWDEVRNMPAIQSRAISEEQEAIVGIPLGVNTPTTLRTQITLRLRDPMMNYGQENKPYGVGTGTPPSEVAQLTERFVAQRLETVSNVVSDPMLMIYHGGKVGSSDLLFEKPLVTPQLFYREFFDRNTVPASRGERYRLVEGVESNYVVYERLRLNVRDEVTVTLLNPEVYELTADERLLQSTDDEFTFNGPHATITSEDDFQLDTE